MPQNLTRQIKLAIIYIQFIFYSRVTMSKHEIIEFPCCENISQRFWVKNKTESQLWATLDKELKYKKNEEDISKYIDNMPVEEKKLIGKFLYMDKDKLIEKLKNDDETIEKFFKFVKFLFSKNEVYWDKNYVLMIEKSILDKIDSSQNLTPENLEFIKTILNNNVQFFNYFFSEKKFSKVINSNILVKRHIIRKLIDKKTITSFNLNQIQKILRWDAFSFNSWTWKMRIETFTINMDKEKQAIIENILLQWKSLEDKTMQSIIENMWLSWKSSEDKSVQTIIENMWLQWKSLDGKSIQSIIENMWLSWKSLENKSISIYSLHVTPGVEIAKDSKNILSTIKQLNELTRETAPCVLLDSWLLDVDYENFCKKLKPILKKKLRENIDNNSNIKDIISKMEANKNSPKKLQELSKKLKWELSSLCAIDDDDIVEDIKWEENKISTRLKVIKEHIIYSTTYKLRDAERCKQWDRFTKERNNIKNNNTEEARRYIKDSIKKWNISWLLSWLQNLVIQEYLFQKYEKDLWLGHWRVIILLDDLK